MELREIISFYHVARLRSVSKAARRLELGQPTVTTHLRKLEEEFGITLFDRIKRPIQLTSDGVTFLELITPIVESVDTLKTQMDYSERRGSFTVGAYPDLVLYHLPRAIKSFRSTYPEVRIRLSARNYSMLMQLVKSGDVDMAICSHPPAEDPNLEFMELFESNIALITPPAHPLLDKHPLQLEEIAKYPLVLIGAGSSTRQRVEQALKAKGIPFEVVLEMDNTELIKRYVEIGMGVSMCGDFALHPEDHDRLGVVRLDHLFPSVKVGVCTLRGKFQGRAVRNFIDTLVEELAGFHVRLWDWDSTHGGEADLSAVGQQDPAIAS